MIPGLYLRLAVAAAIAVFLAGTHWAAYTKGKATVRAEWLAEQLEVGRQSLKLSEQATRDTATLQLNADKLTGAKNAQINRLNADLADALERLRERPSRDSAGSVPEAAAAGASPGCTGAQLYRPDSGFLVRLAARADHQPGLRVSVRAHGRDRGRRTANR